MKFFDRLFGRASRPPIVLQAVGLATGAAVASAEMRVRRNFAIKHLQAARHFADLLRQVEEKHAGAGWGAHFDPCVWYGTAAIILSFSAIEAAVDEIEDDLQTPPNLASGLKNAPTLDHAQALLAYKGVPPLDKGAEPYQSAELLRHLRNGFVHPKAEWDDAQDINKRLSKRVIAAHLPLSPFTTDPSVAFPYGCMSAGVADWAAAAATDFIKELRGALSLDSN